MADRKQSAYISYRILQSAFVFIPIVVGVDKFFHLLVNWDQYLSPLARRVLGSNAHHFMQASGIAEICVGIGMAIKPQVFSYIVAAWLLSIVINLLLTGSFYDVALRDFVLMLASFALGPLSQAFAKASHEKHDEHKGERVA